MRQRQRFLSTFAISSPFLIVQGTFVISLATIVVFSFCKNGPYGEIVFSFSLENYLRLFTETAYWRIILRSVSLALANAALCLVWGLPVAYFIVRASARTKAMLIGLLMLPFATNFLIRTYAWIFILRNDGLLDMILKPLGIEPPNLLFTQTAVLVGLFYNYLPFMVLPLYSNLHRFDFSLVDAAKDLGANKWQSFSAITLPMNKAGLLAGFVLVFIPSLGEFVIPDLLGGARSMMLGNLIKLQFFEGRNWPFGAALTVILTGSASLIMFGFRRLTRGVELSGW